MRNAPSTETLSRNSILTGSFLSSHQSHFWCPGQFHVGGLHVVLLTFHEILVAKTNSLEQIALPLKKGDTSMVLEEVSFKRYQSFGKFGKMMILSPGDVGPPGNVRNVVSRPRKHLPVLLPTIHLRNFQNPYSIILIDS